MTRLDFALDKNIGLYWFTNDLRVADNPALHQAAESVDQLICLYCYPKVDRFLQHFSQQTSLGDARKQFLDESLQDLGQSLNQLGQRLVVVDLHPTLAIRQLVEGCGVTHLFCSQPAGYNEALVIEELKKSHPDLIIKAVNNHALFDQEALPFNLDELPSTFTRFRKKVEGIEIPTESQLIHSLPPIVEGIPFVTNEILISIEPSLFSGGEHAGYEHCQHYFSQRLASTYKQTRNGLMGMEYSTKFSPWLAHGCLSVRSIYAMLKKYEFEQGANDSTYWIYFELLWREYFYWYARHYGHQLFRFSGISGTKPLTSFYAQRFKHWQLGLTPYPIVNACMNQLNETGYMSNRGRQLAASCLIHELGIDWRYGAAYFETQLVDYDVGSNWGNWQYLGGVGADPRGSRRFDLVKQTEIYDPDGEFIAQWRGKPRGEQSTHGSDAVDMVDWPLSSDLPKQ